MNAKVNNDFYNDLKEGWLDELNHPIALLRAENQVRIPWVIDKIKKKMSQGKVLDIGCGAGFLTNALAKEGYHVTGIDLSESSLEVARKSDETASVKYLAADAKKLPFENQTFDVVCAMDLLEHVDDPKEVTAQAARLLKPGGLFFFHTFNRNFLSWLVIIKGVEWFVRNAPPNMHVYNYFIKPGELAGWCRENFLKIEAIEGFMPKINRSFFKMLIQRKIDQNFTFQFNRSLKCGYTGYAAKD